MKNKSVEYCSYKGLTLKKHRNHSINLQVEYCSYKGLTPPILAFS